MTELEKQSVKPNRTIEPFMRNNDKSFKHQLSLVFDEDFRTRPLK